MLKSPDILDTIGLSRCMVNRKGTTSGLTYSPSCSGSGCKKPTLYFCWKEETVNSQVFQKMLNSKIVPVAYTAYREHNFVYSSYRYINCFKDNGLAIFWSLGNRTPCYPDPNSLVSFFLRECKMSSIWNACERSFSWGSLLLSSGTVWNRTGWVLCVPRLEVKERALLRLKNVKFDEIYSIYSQTFNIRKII